MELDQKWEGEPESRRTSGDSFPWFTAHIRFGQIGAGIHPKVVAERLGHSTIRITLNRYSHALPHIQDDAAERVEESL